MQVAGSILQRVWDPSGVNPVLGKEQKLLLVAREVCSLSTMSSREHPEKDRGFQQRGKICPLLGLNKLGQCFCSRTWQYKSSREPFLGTMVKELCFFSRERRHGQSKRRVYQLMKQKVGQVIILTISICYFPKIIGR